MTLVQLINEDGLENTNSNDVFDILLNSSDIEDRLNLCFDLFYREPSYHMLYELNLNYDLFTEEEKQVVWNRYAPILDEINNSKQLELIKYSLAIDYFDDVENLKNTWEILLSKVSKTGLKRILSVSGHVLSEYKIPVYIKNLNDMDMHESILFSIYHSLILPYGRIDFESARKILDSLKINSSLKTVSFTKEYLNNYNKKTNETTQALALKHNLKSSNN